MPSFLKKLKSSMTANAPVSDHTITTEFIASNTRASASIDGPSVFEFRHKFSAMQPQPTLIPRSSSSSSSSGITAQTQDSSPRTESSSTTLEDLLPPVGAELHFKVKSVLSARPDIMSTEVGQEYHGMWCKTKKLVKGFFKSKDHKKTSDEHIPIDETNECEHKFRHGCCKRCMVYEHDTSKSTDAFTHSSSRTTSETTQSQNQTPGIGMETMIRYFNEEIPPRPILETPLPPTSNGMSIEALIRNIIPMGMPTPIPNVVSAVSPIGMGMPTLLRTLDAAIEGNRNDISPCPPQIGPITYHATLKDTLRDHFIQADGTVVDGSPLSGDFVVRNRSSNELFLHDDGASDFGHSSDFGLLEDETPILICARRIYTPNNAACLQVFEDPESPSYRRGLDVFFPSPIANPPSPRHSPEQLASSALYNTFIGTGDLELAENNADEQAEAGMEDDSVVNFPTQLATPEQNTTESNNDWRNYSPTLFDLITHVRSISNYDERPPIQFVEQESSSNDFKRAASSSAADDADDEGYNSSSSSSSTYVPSVMSPNIAIRSSRRRVLSLVRSQGTTNLMVNHVRLPSIEIVPFAPFNTNAQASLD